MVKIIAIISLTILLSNKVYSASNNLFFTTAQFITYCKSENPYEQGICDGYIIAINDVIFSLEKENGSPFEKLIRAKVKICRLEKIYTGWKIYLQVGK